MDTTQSRWKSPVFWTSIFALVAFVLGNYGLYDVIGMTSETFQTFINLLLSAMMAFGIVNNPTNKDGF